MTSEQAREQAGPGSLIQQRIALRRLRMFGSIFLVFGLLGVAAGVAMTVTGTVAWIGLTMSAVWLCFGALGVVMLLRYHQQRAAFESAHGAGAGEQ
jgi:Flp pilus assembly protein TadB